MDGVYTRFFGSQVENTLTISLILLNLDGWSVENLSTPLWKNLWKIDEHFGMPTL